MNDPLNVDLTATMTANNAPSPNVVSASSQYDADYPPYKAFNDLVGATFGWASIDSGLPAWLKYDFGAGNTHRIEKYTITSINTNQAPKNWVLEGSNNDSDWTTLDTQTGIAFTDIEKKTFTFINAASYRYFRITVSVVGSGSLAQILEMELMRTTEYSSLEAAFFAFFK